MNKTDRDRIEALILEQFAAHGAEPRATALAIARNVAQACYELGRESAAQTVRTKIRIWSDYGSISETILNWTADAIEAGE